MNKVILTTEVQDFINANLNTDVSKLAFKGSPFKTVSTQELMHQIVSKNKCREKIPTWFKTPFIYYPNKINIEQSSSEQTAQYKTSLVNGNTIIDLTGGLGVDSFYFSKIFKDVIHCEIDPELAEIAAYNFERLNVFNITAINSDGISYLVDNQLMVDWIYMDPSRRNEQKGKVFRLADCLPNVPIHLDCLFNHTNSILIKTSPLLDLSVGIKELQFVTEIHIVAVENEVKEVLFILKKNTSKPVTVKTIHFLKSSTQRFDFMLDDENHSVHYSATLKYLYEPNKAILKSGAFNTVAKRFAISKIAPNTHLYTSDEIVDFPGRCYEIIAQVPYQKKKILEYLPNLKANIKIRNFPDAILSIKKKLQLKDGGDFYVFFTTDKDKKQLILITKKAQ